MSLMMMEATWQRLLEVLKEDENEVVDVEKEKEDEKEQLMELGRIMIIIGMLVILRDEGNPDDVQ